MTEYSYVVTYDPAGTNQVITEFVQFVKLTLSGSGEIRSGKLILDGNRGAFMTNANFTGAGKTPIIDEFDPIEIAITDDASITQTHRLEVDDLQPSEDGQRGSILTVDLLGPERHLMKVPFKKQFDFEDAFTIVRDIIDAYNDPDSKGLGQPSISDHDNTTGNTFPKYTANQTHFNVSELPAYSAIRKTGDRVGSSVAAGGGGDFWDWHFITDGDNIKLRSTISGLIDSGVTITDSVSVNPGEEEGFIESTKATVHMSWGADQFGSTPAQVSEFAGALEAWQFSKDYETGVTYPTSSIVRRVTTGPDSQGDELHYKANKSTAIAPPTTETSNADWDSYNFLDFLTNEISISGQYSPYTNAKDDEWKVSGANPDGTEQDDPPLTTSLYTWDSNQVVVDGTFKRRPVDWRGTNPTAIPTNYVYGGVVATGLYRGFTALVDGVGAGDFTGFDNNIVVYDPALQTANKWRIFRTTADDEFVCVDDEAKVYKRAGGTWSDDSNNAEANDAYHPVYSITNTAGHNNHNNGAGGTYGDNSAVTYEYRYTKSDNVSTNARKYYRSGAWINWKVPFPHSDYQGISPTNDVGYLYGNNPTKKEPVTLDANNMHFSPSGKIGFNHVEANEYGPLEGPKFMTKFDWKYKLDGTGNSVPLGNFPCRCFMYDISYNVVIQDFTVAFNNKWEQIFLPFSGFTNYRARTPWSLGENLIGNIFLQDLEILNRFEYKNIKKIGFQWMGPYDDEGRFRTFLNLDFLYPSLEDVISGAFVDGYNIKWSIDAFHFAKPLLAVSAPKTGAGERALFDKASEYPLISNDYQLNQANEADLEIKRFRRKEFIVVTEGRNNINLFETFTLSNTNLINDSDSGANTIDLVAKKIELTIDKTPTGPGGFLRTITGIKRFV